MVVVPVIVGAIMAMEVLCPGCGKTLKAPESKAGKKAVCKKCGTRFRIPGTKLQPHPATDPASPVAESHSPGQTPPVAAEPAPRKKPKTRRKTARPAEAANDRATVPTANSLDIRSPSPKPPKSFGSEKPAPTPEMIVEREPLAPTNGVPEPPAGESLNNPFAFLSPASGAAASQPVNPQAGKVDRGQPIEVSEDRPSYHTRRQPGSRPLMFAMMLGLLAMVAAVAAIIAFMKQTQPPEQAQSPEQPAELVKPATEPTTGATSTSPDTTTPATVSKDTAAPTPGNLQPQPTVPMMELPLSLPTFLTRASPVKPTLVQKPTSDTFTFEAPFEKVRRFFPPADRVSHDAIIVWESGAAALGKGPRLTVDVHSGMTGTRVSRFAFDADPGDVRCDLSADGRLFAAVGTTGKITVWDLAKNAKLLDGFNPYADKPEHARAGIAAVFLPATPGTVLTVTTAGAAHLFEIGSQKLSASFGPTGLLVPNRVEFGRSVVADDSRSSIILAVGGVVYQIGTAAPLATAWKLELGGDVARSLGVGGFGVPGRIAYAFETNNSGRKERAIAFGLPKQKAKLFRWPEMAGEVTGVAWAGTDLVVISTGRGAVWFESEAKSFSPLALAEIDGGKALHAATERALWYVVPSSADPAKSVLIELATPPEGLIDFRNAVEGREALHTVKLDDKGLWR